MERLALEIPPFQLRRKCIIGAQPSETYDKIELYCRGADIEYKTLSMDIFHEVKFLSCTETKLNENEEIQTDMALERLSSNRGQFVQTCNLPESLAPNLKLELPVKLEFKGH